MKLGVPATEKDEKLMAMSLEIRVRVYRQRKSATISELFNT